MSIRDQTPTLAERGGAGGRRDEQRSSSPDERTRRAQLPEDWSPGAGQDAAKTVRLNVPPPSFAWLVMVVGDRPGRLFNINPAGFTLGRDGVLCDAIIDDPAVSRQHTKIRLEDAGGAEGRAQRYLLYDLATSNGTLVNGSKVVRQILTDGDRIEVGKATLVFKEVVP